MAPAAKCTKCGKNVSPTDLAVECDTCGYWFHTICVKIPNELYDLIGTNNNIGFNCTKCLGKTAVRDDNTDSAIVEELDKRFLNYFKTFSAELGTEQQGLKNTLEASIAEIRSDISATLPELQQKIEHCNGYIKKVEDSAMNKISRLELEQYKMQRRLNRGDIVITGLPAGIDKLIDPVLTICSFFNVRAEAMCINNCVYTRNGKSILVTFYDIRLRDELMKAYFKKPKIQLNNVINTDVTSRVYLNDNLIPAANRLQILCRTLRKNKKIIWFRIRNGNMPLAKVKLPDGTITTMDEDTCSSL